LLPKFVKIKIHRTIIFPVVLNACSSERGGKREEGRGVYRVLVGKPEGKRPLGDPGVDGMIILRWIFRKWDV
jgi:hypothetical protein